ncbi:anti-sigma regulatory factor [Streptomyces sp. NRRL S-104]|nr:ATP-binding protein [Streptomyces sp. NRRL S-104]
MSSSPVTVTTVTSGCALTTRSNLLGSMAVRRSGIEAHYGRLPRARRRPSSVQPSEGHSQPSETTRAAGRLQACGVSHQTRLVPPERVTPTPGTPDRPTRRRRQAPVTVPQRSAVASVRPHCPAALGRRCRGLRSRSGASASQARRAKEEQVTTAVLDQSLSRTGWPGAAAREATRAFLARAARLRAPTRDGSMDDVLLVVAELVANATRHTDGPSSLHLELLDDAVDVCVCDPSPRPPEPRTPRTDGSGGWGWFMIQRLATHIRIGPAVGGGKIICAKLPW